METLSIILFTDLIEKVCVIFVMAYLLTRLKYFTEVLDGKLTIKNQIILILIFGVYPSTDHILGWIYLGQLPMYVIWAPW